ncbi:MAG TPA: TIGR03032 family protein, partial [Marmoricola sp.]
GRPPRPDARGLRLLEKTPKNSLRVPFLRAAFPDARFVFVQRDPAESLSSMIAAWESGRFVTYPDLPDWPGDDHGLPWSLLLTPEWRSLRGKELPEIVAEQWRMASEILLTDLERLPADRWGVIGYHDLLADPDGEIRRLCQFLDIEWDNELDDQLPLSRYTLTPPSPDKWRQHADLLDRVLPSTQDAARRGREALARPVTLSAPLSGGAPDPTSPYRSVSSGTFAELLGQLGSTVLASTYQTGKVVAVRALDGRLNTHFRPFESPMGMAYRNGRLAIGTRTQVWDLQNVPQVTSRLEDPQQYDACFVPRSARFTGDIRIHDVAWAGDELWAVATRFSSLVTLDGDHSFVPRWQPSFITALAPEDRCHLNGLATVDNRVRYVTALGVSDTAGGWRENKAAGGVIIDVDSDEIVAAGISMPHSPRWHRGRLWVLESGQGALSVVDLDSGKLETVAELPGFTRGLAMVGPFAFVGLSEVREATTFGGLPLTARLENRECGIWVVNVETGETVAFLRFEDLVEEIFDITVLPGIRFPEIAEPGSDAASNSFVVPTLDGPA